jgi:hypothetical protein
LLKRHSSSDTRMDYMDPLRVQQTNIIVSGPPDVKLF